MHCCRLVTRRGGQWGAQRLHQGGLGPPRPPLGGTTGHKELEPKQASQTLVLLIGTAEETDASLRPGDL